MDVRMIQLEANGELVSMYASEAVKRGFSGIFAVVSDPVDPLCAIALKAGLELGRRIPREFAVIGFDNLDVAGQQLIYPLTTLAQPKERIGELAGSMLINLLEGRDAGPVILEAPLIIRSTTAVSADRQ